MKINDPIAKLAERPTSLRAAITAKCWDCIGRDADPQPTRRIRECPCTGCPLHRVRPYQHGAPQDSDVGEPAEPSEAQP